MQGCTALSADVTRRSRWKRCIDCRVLRNLARWMSGCGGVWPCSMVDCFGSTTKQKTLRISPIHNRILSHRGPLLQIGAVLLTAHHASTERNQTIFFIVAQFIFGCAQSPIVLCCAFDAAASNLITVWLGSTVCGNPFIVVPYQATDATHHRSDSAFIASAATVSVVSTPWLPAPPLSAPRRAASRRLASGAVRSC